MTESYSKSYEMKFFILAYLTVLCYCPALAQNVNWNEIESSIGFKQNLSDQFQKLEKIKQQAIQNSENAVVARCYWYQVMIADLKTEDSLYFKNSFCIDSILKSNKEPLMQSIMLLLKARRIHLFRDKFYYRSNKNLFLIPGGTTDYTKMTIDELDSLAESYFYKAQKISVTLTNEKTKDVLWLSADPLLFLFAPGFADIVFAEQLRFKDRTIRNKFLSNSNWISLMPGDFIRNTQLPKGIDSQYLGIFRLYHEWAVYHQQNNAAFYFIESLAKQYFFNHLAQTDSAARLYETYLQFSLQSPYPAVGVHALFQLCLHWKKMGDRYYTSYSYNNYNTACSFDSSYRYYYLKTLQLIKEKNQSLDSFLYLKKNLLKIGNQIRDKKLNIINNDKYLPGAPIQLTVQFKNIPAIFLKVVKLSNLEFKSMQRKTSSVELLKAAAFKTLSVTLPVTGDYQFHQVDIDAGTLPAGCYAVVFSDSLIAESKDTFDYFLINVTSIAVINNDSRIFVLNRKTGLPLSNSRLLVRYKPDHNKPATKEMVKKVNADGYVFVTQKNIVSAFAICGNDTTLVEINEIKENRPEKVFNKAEDELVDYYEDQLSIHLFTDRAIYRPGQTMHFKGIALTREPATGKLMAFNKGNIKFPFLKKIFNREIKEFTNAKIKVYINDAFGKAVDSVNVTVNDFGSFAGSYKISSDAATGDWEFDTDYIDIDNRNDGHFKVEEYKRQTFEFQLEKPQNYLQLGDSFFVKGKLRSFAGASLNNVKVSYTLAASFYTPSQNATGQKLNEVWNRVTIADTSGYTDHEGVISIMVPADFLKQYHFNNEMLSEITYNIEAEAVDPTGESHDASLDIRLSNRPVKIDFSLAPVYEKKELGIISVTAKNDFSGTISKRLEAKIYKLTEKPALKRNNADNDYILNNNQWIYNPQESRSAIVADTILIYETSLMSNTEKLQFPKELLQTGNYCLTIICKENGNITGTRSRNFSLFDSETNTYADTTKDFYYLPKNGVVKGQTISWFFGTTKKEVYGLYHIQYNATTKTGVKVKYLYDLQKNQKDITEWKFTVPDDVAEGEITFTHLYIQNNELFKQSATLYLVKQLSDDPEIIVERYRHKLMPGSKETFSVTIKTKNENVAAELMTTMYDASLDKIEEHHWDKPDDHIRYYVSQQWPDEIINAGYSSLIQSKDPFYVYANEIKKIEPLWWLNPLDYAYDENSTFNSMILYGGNDYISNQLQTKVSGINISSGHFDEVVVIGYGTAKKSLTGSVATIRIRGISSLGSVNAPLIIIDGIPYTGDLAKLNTDLITDAVSLNGADATSIYGSRAANGLILISTKGMVELPTPEPPPVIVRKNFAETAFFFPQVHADAKGYFNISFDIPESVTEWNWKMMAHTRDAKFIYAERVITTQLPMMVQPNMPRFLFQGDEINLQTRISNLDTNRLSGVSNCLIEDVVTGEDISSLVSHKIVQSFTLDSKSNSTVAYQLKIPQGLLHPLKIKITARAGNFSDGEEYTIPILSKKILVTQHIPFTYSNNVDSIISTPIFPEDARAFGIGMYISPKPQAAMINALPYLAFYPYNCAEQTFNKMMAYSMAVKLASHDSIAQQALRQLPLAGESIIGKSIPGELSEATMPWLQLNHRNSIQQQRLRKLFDTLRGKAMIGKYLAELSDLQNKDGGICWFKGGKSNKFISSYLLAGFGRLKKDSISFLFDKRQETNFKILPSLVSYCDKTFATTLPSATDNLFYLYARSFWQKEYPIAESLITKADTVLNELWNNVNNYHLAKQALLVVTSMLYPKSRFYNKANRQLESIRQLAITDKVSGTRWKDISNTDDFDNTDEETIAMLATAFDETVNSKDIVTGIIQWLLNAKEQHNWSNTKATAAVVNLLQKQQTVVTGIPAHLNANAGDSALYVTDNLFTGQLTAFKQLTGFPAAVSLVKSGSGIVSGGLNYYYFTASPPVNDPKNEVKISKQLFKLGIKDNWEMLNTSTVLKIADKVKTVITIHSPRQLKYVFIDEGRSAACEPAKGMSGYEYGMRFSYYQSVRDAGYQFFAEQIPSGISTIEYETIIANEGIFSSGTVELQCMYQPQVKAYGQGIIIRVSGNNN